MPNANIVPELKKAYDIKNIREKVNQNFKFGTPEYFEAVSTELAQNGYQNEALKAQEVGLGFLSKQMSIEKDKTAIDASKKASLAEGEIPALTLKTNQNILSQAVDRGVDVQGATPEMFTSEKATMDYVKSREDASKPNTKTTIDKDNAQAIIEEILPSGEIKFSVRDIPGMKKKPVKENANLTPEERVTLHSNISETLMDKLPEDVSEMYSEDIYPDPKKRRDAIIKRLTSDKPSNIEKAEASLAEAEEQLANDPENKGLQKKVDVRLANLYKVSGYEEPVEGMVMTDDAVDFTAQMYLTTGKMPPMGRGKQAAINRARILERASGLAKEKGMDGHAAAFAYQQVKSLQMASQQLEKQRAQVGNYKKTAIRNADLAVSLSDKTNRTGVPVFNRWLNSGRKNILGDVEVSNFHAANNGIVTEYAKIMSGALGGTVTSDSARADANEVLSTAMTVDQYKGVIDTLKTEMNNRMIGFEEEAAEIQERKEKALNLTKEVNIDGYTVKEVSK